MMTYFKRLARYVLNGQPKIEIKAAITTSDRNNILKGRRIVITGGGRGLGHAIAKKCIASGANVLITGRNEETLKSAVDDNEKMSYIPMDVTDFNNYSAFFDEAERILDGKIDTLVNNAGISLHEGWYESVTLDSWDRQFNTNLKAPYFLSKEFISRIDDNDSRSKNIIFISSERGLYCDDIPYGLIKAAINSLTQGLGRRLLNRNIYVNAIAPGVTASDMTGYDATGNLYRPQACSKRVYRPEEVAELAVFLISDLSKCISSQIIPTQNGNHLRCDW